MWARVVQSSETGAIEVISPRCNGSGNGVSGTRVPVKEGRTAGRQTEQGRQN